MPIIEKLQTVLVPETLSREEALQFFSQALLGEAADISGELNDILDLLDSNELDKLIDEGKVTVAMVKPKLDEATNSIGIASDSEIDLKIRSEISPPLKEIFSLSLVFTPDMVEEWYGGEAKERQLQAPPYNENRYGVKHKTRWDEYKSLMTSGPVTVSLLYDESGNAILEWRTQMGNHWNITKVKELFPNSLRGRFGMDNHNNLLHGSDSPDSVHREINLLKRFLREYSELLQKKR